MDIIIKLMGLFLNIFADEYFGALRSVRGWCVSHWVGRILVPVGMNGIKVGNSIRK